MNLMWQRNYYERIIREDGELKRAREYIINNPAAGSSTKRIPRVASVKCTRITGPGWSQANESLR